MTEYESAELTFSLVGYGMTALALYFTIVSGYLIGAYMVGSKLLRSQVLIVTSLFIVFELILVFGSYSFFEAANRFGESSSDSIVYWLGSVVAIAELIGIFGALKFMYDIRHEHTTLKSKIQES